MCVAIPGRVIRLEDNTAVVDFSGNEVRAYIGLVDCKVDDYVLVHAGCIIQKMKKQEADEMIELMNGF